VGAFVLLRRASLQIDAVPERAEKRHPFAAPLGGELHRRHVAERGDVPGPAADRLGVAAPERLHHRRIAWFAPVSGGERARLARRPIRIGSANRFFDDARRNDRGDARRPICLFAAASANAATPFFTAPGRRQTPRQTWSIRLSGYAVLIVVIEPTRALV